MIVWLNGPFGGGKTTVANLLCARPDLRLFDPEHVGYLVAGHLGDHEFADFQDLAPWRRLVPVVAGELHTFTTTSLVLPQTVLVEYYWQELAQGFAQQGLDVVHVLLDCEPDELVRRIESDEAEHEVRQWRLDHVAPYRVVREGLRQSVDLVVDTTDLDPQTAAASLIEALVGR